jgi:hypothetical protein
MKNIFYFLVSIIILCLILFLGWRYFSGQISELEEKNSKLSKDISNIQLERDSLQPIMEKLKLQQDSLYRVDSCYKKELEDLRNKNILIEKKLSRSIDSLNKYKPLWFISRKKYQDIKKSKRKPTNQQVLEFFKKY